MNPRITRPEATYSIKDYTLTVTLLEHLSEAVFLLDSQGLIEYANGPALHLLGLPFESVRQRSIDDFIVQVQDESLLGNDSLKTTERIKLYPINDQEALIQSPSRLIPVIIACNQIPASAESHSYYLLTAKDLSHRRETEFEMQSDQVLSIYRNRLKTISSLSLSLLHSLTQPLMALQLQTELFQKNYANVLSATSGGMHRLDEISQSIKKINDILDGIREFARWSLEEHLVWIDLQDIFKRAQSLLSYEIEYHKIELHINIAEDFPRLFVYPILLTEAIFNLLKNAVEAHQDWDDQGTGKKISLAGIVGQHHWVEIVVEDNAPAIPSEHRSKIFKPYFTTKNGHEHAGLGLTVAQKIFGTLGGDLSYYSTGCNHNAFRGRLPVSWSDERNTLQNLIEFHHHHR